MSMTHDKAKVMIIKSNKITYDTFVHDNNNLDKVTSYKYLGNRYSPQDSTRGIIALRKGLLGDGKLIMGLKTYCKSTDLWSWDKKKQSSLRLLLHLVILYGCEF
jgi:hypothetical protein